jgi:peptide/nickel transport system permease protein
VSQTAELADRPAQDRRERARSVRRGRRPRNRAVWVSCAFLVLVAFAAAFPGVVAPGDPLALHPTVVLQGPSAAHLLGTDEYGRSVFALLAHGARAALVVGLVCAASGGIVGSAMGMVAGFFGGVTDQSLMRLNDILMCFPGILLALLVGAALGSSLENEIIAVSVGTVPMYARVARGETLRVRGMLYVDSAIVAGLPRRQIIWRHVLPNVLAPLVVVATLAVGVSIVLAASLSFLGLGPVGGVPDWGSLLADGETNISVAWWISTFPGIAITLVVVATNVLGDWLRDRLDVAAR